MEPTVPHITLITTTHRNDPTILSVGWRAVHLRSPNQATTESIFKSQITLPVNAAAEIRRYAIWRHAYKKEIARQNGFSRQLPSRLRVTLPVNKPTPAKKVAADVAPRIWPPEKEKNDKENVNRRVTATRDPCRRHAKQSHRRFRLRLRS